MNLCDIGGDYFGNVGVDSRAGDVVSVQNILDVVFALIGCDNLRFLENGPDAGQSIVSLASLDALLTELGINLSESLALSESLVGSNSLCSALGGSNASQMFRVGDEDVKEAFGVPPSYSVEQFVVLSLEGGPAPRGGVLDDGPDLSPLLVRESDSVPVELVVDFLEHMAFVDPAIDNFLLSLLDDCFSCSLPS